MAIADMEVIILSSQESLASACVAKSPRASTSPFASIPERHFPLGTPPPLPTDESDASDAGQGDDKWPPFVGHGSDDDRRVQVY